MKFIIKQEILLESLYHTSRAISPRNLIPILTGIKFDLKDDGLYLYASDTDVSITSLDVDGGASSDIVAGKWVRINCPTVDGNASTWTQVGGSTVKFLRAVGVAAADGNIIKGTVNDGIANTIGSKVNYTEINIKVHVPLNAVPGTKSWKMRLTGYYV